jgi:predicted SAM-dependent methyltransferase
MARQLHIGGTVRKEGWEVLNALPGEHVDHLGNAIDLSRFNDGTFDCIYASHVLEHFDYSRELPQVLREWNRVLKQQGRLLLSIPDLSVLCTMLIEKDNTLAQQFMVMRMIFGGHVDEYDHHKAGLNEELLSAFLHDTGYACCRRVQSHGLFVDTSDMIYKGRRISLNMVAYKDANTAREDGLEVVDDARI